MAEEYENVLKSLKLEDNAALEPWGRISNIFQHLQENHLYVVVERPPTGEFECPTAPHPPPPLNRAFSLHSNPLCVGPLLPGYI
jgi:hypothetical protein